MTRDSPRSLAAYARAVERLGNEVGGTPRILSPREWAHVRAWHERGVPLPLIRECFAEAARRRRARRPPSVARIAPAVEEAWTVVQSGRLAAGVPAAAPAAPAADPTGEAWARALAATPPGALRDALTELGSRQAGGAPASEIDAELDARLIEFTEPEILAEVLDRVDRELAPYRERMTREALETTRRRATIRRLRDRLGLSRRGEAAQP